MTNLDRNLNLHLSNLVIFGVLIVVILFLGLLSQNSHSSGDYPKELYNDCLKVAGKSFCDYLFEKDNSTPASSINNSSSSVTGTSNSTYLNYKDKDLGFSIEYPSDWTIDNANSQFYTVVGFDPPNKDASVDIRVFPKGSYKSIKDFGDKNFKESDEQTLLAYYRNSSTVLGGKPAFKAIYLTTYNPSLFENAFGYKSSTSKAMMVATVVPEKKSIFAVAYFAKSNNFDDYLPTIEKMINSFQIYGKGPVIQEDNGTSSTS